MKGETMKQIFILLFLVLFSVQVEAAVIVYGQSGTASSAYTTPEAACAAPNVKRIEITSPYTLTAGLTCPSDRSLHVALGGLLTNNSGTATTINGPFSADGQAFSGSGSVVINSFANNPTGWFAAGQTVTFNGGFTAPPKIISSAMVIGTVKVSPVYPEWWLTNTTPLTTDMTAGIRSAAANSATGTVLLTGKYKVDTTGNPITIAPYQSVEGLGRNTTQIENSSTTDYTFSMLQPGTGVITSSTIFEKFKLTAKFGIQINKGGALHINYKPILGVVIRNCDFYGAYYGDPNEGTAVYPAVNADGTDNFLIAGYGVAVNMAKVLDGQIYGNQFVRNGIAINLEGSDVNNIYGNRMIGNGRYVHIAKLNTADGNWGGRNTIGPANDMLSNLRRGGIYDTAMSTKITGNYFESYFLSGEAYTNRGGFNNTIIGNSFDNNRTTTPLMSIASYYGVLVSSNNLTYGSGPLPFIEVLDTNYGPSPGIGNNFFVKFFGNNGSFENTKQPWCEYDFNNPRVFDAYNPKALAGVVSTTFPFKVSPTSGKHVVKTATNSLIVYMETKPTDTSLTLVATGTYISGAGFAAVTWGGVSASATNFGFTNIAGIQTKSVTFAKPASVAPDSGLSIELLPMEVEYQSIELK